MSEVENVVEEVVVENVEKNAPDEVQAEESVEEVVEDENKSVPLDTFLSTKKRAKEAEKRIRELEEKFMSKERNDKITSLQNKLREKGYDEDFISIQTEMYDDLYSSLAPKSNEDDLLVEEIKDLAEYGGKADALQYKDKIIEKVKNNGLTVEEAYLLASRTAPKVYQSEVRTQVEQINAAKRRKNADATLNSSGGGSASVSLNADEKQMLETMRKMYPDRNWTAEKLKKLNNSLI